MVSFGPFIDDFPLRFTKLFLSQQPLQTFGFCGCISLSPLQEAFRDRWHLLCLLVRHDRRRKRESRRMRGDNSSRLPARAGPCAAEGPRVWVSAAVPDRGAEPGVARERLRRFGVRCVARAFRASAFNAALDTEGTRGAASRRTPQPCVAPRSAPVCGKSPPAAHCGHLRVFLNLISPRSHQNYNGEGK